MTIHHLAHHPSSSDRPHYRRSDFRNHCRSLPCGRIHARTTRSILRRHGYRASKLRSSHPRTSRNSCLCSRGRLSQCTSAARSSEERQSTPERSRQYTEGRAQVSVDCASGASSGGGVGADDCALERRLEAFLDSADGGHHTRHQAWSSSGGGCTPDRGRDAQSTSHVCRFSSICLDCVANRSSAGTLRSYRKLGRRR